MFDSKEIARRALLLAAETKEKRAQRRAKLMTSSAGLLACVCVIAAVILFSVPQKESGQTISTIVDDQPPLAYPDFVETASGIKYPAVEEIAIRAGEAEVEISLANPESNTCCLTFEIILAESGERLCISEPAAPSERIGKQTLLIELAEGKYSAELIMRAYEPDSREELEMTSVAFTLSVE